MAVEHIILSLTTSPPRWCHPQHGEGEGELSAMPAQGRHALVVLVPGREVLLSRVSLPAGNRQRLRQALPFAMEDQLVQDVDHYHFALGPKLKSIEESSESQTTGEFYLAAAVAMQAMQGWMDLLTQAGLKPDVLLPAPLVLPLPEHDGYANVFVEGSAALVRCGSDEAFEVSVADLNLLLSLKPELKGLNVSDLSASWPDNGALPRKLLKFGQWPKDFGVTPAKAPLNLLQGTWQGRGDAAGRIAGIWRWAAIAVCAAGLLTLVNRYLEVAELKRQMQSLDNTAREVVNRVVPQIPPGSSYREALTDSLARLQGVSGGAENGFFYLLEIIGPALVRDGGVSLSSMSFRSDGLMLDLTATSLDQVETLRRQISEQAPVAVVIESSETVVEGTRVRMRIGGELGQ